MRFGLGSAELHIIPAPAGAKRGAGKIILGTVIMAAAIASAQPWAVARMVVNGQDGIGAGSTVDEIKRQFEVAIGRPMSEGEWGRLLKHAARHAERVMVPLMTRGR